MIEIALRQHGLIAVRQLLERGWTTDAIGQLVDSGRLLRLRRGVLAVAGMPPTFEQAVLAAALAAGPGVVASHRTAGSVWRLECSPHDVTAIDLLCPEPQVLRLDGVRGHRSAALFDADRTKRGRIPVTTLARTVIDLSGVVPEHRFGSLVDEALRKGMRLDALVVCAGRLGAGRGRRMGIVRQAIADRRPGYDPGESDLETRVLRALVAGGLPPPRQQVRVTMSNGQRVRLDMAYLEEKLPLEADGYKFHGGRDAFDRGHIRDAALLRDGWAPTVHFTSKMSDHEIVTTTIAALERARRAIA